MTNAILYDLASANRDVRFSPFCWLAKLALKHKQVPFETVPLGFLPKSDYPDADYGKLPMLKIGDELLKGSDVIVEYLDRTIKERPLDAGPEATLMLDKIKTWTGEKLFPNLAPLMFFRVSQALEGADRDYFVKSREERFGTDLKSLSEKPGLKENLQSAIDDLSQILGESDYFSGDAPALADYLAISPILWQRSISADTFYSPKPNIAAWQDRMLNLYDDYGRGAVCAGC